MNIGRLQLSPQNAQEVKDYLLQLSYPSTCPWKIEVGGLEDKNEHGSQACEIRINKNGEIFNINSYIPKEKNGKLFLSESQEMDQKKGKSWLDKDVIISKRIIQNPIFLIILLHEIGHTRTNTSTKDLLLQALQGKTKEQIYKEERLAWGEAMRIIRDLRKKGLKIEEGISKKDIESLMNYSLLSYEYAFDPEGKSAPIMRGIKRAAFEVIEN